MIKYIHTHFPTCNCDHVFCLFEYTGQIGHAIHIYLLNNSVEENS